MAQLALTVVGGAIGSIIPGVGTSIGMMVGGAIGGALFGPTVEGPRLNDLTVTSSTYGNSIPHLYGTARMSGNLIWSSGIKEKKTKKSGGKGGPKQTTYSYSASFAVAFCAGPVSQMVRIWADSKLISGDAPIKLQPGQSYKDYVAILNKQKKKQKIKFRVYLGGEDQLPDSIIVADKGMADTPAYRGMCYIVFDDLPLEDFGNRIPSITAEISNNNSFNFPRVDPLMSDGDAFATFWVDWEANRIWRDVGNQRQFAAIDLSTMDEVYRVSSDVLTGQWCFGRGGTTMFSNNGNTGTNSLPYNSYDGNTLTHLNTFCRGSRNLGVERNPECEMYSPATQAYVRLGPNASIRVNGGNGYSNYLLHTSTFANIWVLMDSAGFWHCDGVLNIVNANLLVLDEAEYGSRVMWWGNDGPNGFRAKVLGIPPGGLRTKITPEYWKKECPWIMHYEADPRMMSYEIATGGAPGYARFECQAIAFDQSNNCFFMVGNFFKAGPGTASKAGCMKFSLDANMVTMTRVWDDLDYEVPLPVFDGLKTSRLNGDTLGWVGQTWTGAPSGYLVDMNTGAIRSAPLMDDALPYWGTFIGTPACSWDDVSKSVVTNAFEQVIRYYFADTGQGVTVASIVTDLCKKTALLDQADIDVAALESQTVPGYVISRESSAKDCLTQLAGAYFFDGVESDYKLKFVTRGGNSVATIDESQLGYVEDRDIAIKETRTQEVELPMRITVNYYSQERDYQIGSQYAKRISNPVPSMFSNQESKTELPMVMTATEAKRIADKGLKMVWTNRTSIETALPWQFLLHDPCDVVKVKLPSKGLEYNLRLTKVDLGVDYNIRLSAVTESAVAYTSVVVGDSGAVPIQSAGDPGNVGLVVLNTPLLRDTDDTQGVSSIYYVGFYEKTSIPAKSVVVVESKNGEDYSDVAFLDSALDTGICMTKLGDIETGESTDEINELRVRMYNQTTLETVTQLQMLDGANAAVIGNEIINFREAELQDDGTYILRGILRGRRNTQPFLDSHAVGERFILLDPSKLATVKHGPQDWNSQRYLKAVPIGTLQEDAETVRIDFEPNDLKPYPPTNVKMSYDFEKEEAVITFSRTSRITAPLKDGEDEVSYREGQGSVAAMKYEVWSGNMPGDMAAYDAAIKAGQDYKPTYTGTVPIYGENNAFAPLTIRFPYPMNFITNNGRFTVRIWEKGFVDGYMKTVGFYAEPGIDGIPDGKHWGYSELF